MRKFFHYLGKGLAAVAVHFLISCVIGLPLFGMTALLSLLIGWVPACVVVTLLTLLFTACAIGYLMEM